MTLRIVVRNDGGKAAEDTLLECRLALNGVGSTNSALDHLIEKFGLPYNSFRVWFGRGNKGIHPYAEVGDKYAGIVNLGPKPDPDSRHGALAVFDPGHNDNSIVFFKSPEMAEAAYLLKGKSISKEYNEQSHVPKQPVFDLRLRKTFIDGGILYRVHAGMENENMHVVFSGMDDPNEWEIALHSKAELDKLMPVITGGMKKIGYGGAISARAINYSGHVLPIKEATIIPAPYEIKRPVPDSSAIRAS